MKLRARFPQIGLALSDGAGAAARGALRRAWWPTSRSGAGSAMPETAAEPGRPAPGFIPVTTNEFAPQVEWPSTVAAWRSTTGKPGDRA